MGANWTGPSLWVWFLQDSFNKGTIRIETIRCSIRQLQQPTTVKVKSTIHCISIVITQHLDFVLYKQYDNI